MSFFVKPDPQECEVSPMSRPMSGPSARPAVSPYINLSGRNPVVNYYGIIRPQLETRSLEAQQRQTLQQLERRLKEGDTKSEELLALPRTGHRSYFMNYSHYYPFPR
jgi:hypothetical protein